MRSRPPRVSCLFCPDSNVSGLVYSGARNGNDYKRDTCYNFNCPLKTYRCLKITPTEAYGITSGSSGRRKDVVNQCLKFAQKVDPGEEHSPAAPAGT